MDPMKHNYMKKLVALWQEGKVPRACPTDVAIYHDDWCAVYDGGYCNCDPDVVLTPLPPWLFAGRG